VEDNPLYEDKPFAFQGVITHGSCAKMRAMTIGGLCIFLDIAVPTWFEYAKREGFSNVTTRAEEIIRNQKFTGAAADLLNPNIIARDLGLRDKRDVDMNLNVSADDLSDADLAEIVRREQGK